MKFQGKLKSFRMIAEKSQKDRDIQNRKEGNKARGEYGLDNSSPEKRLLKSNQQRNS